MAKRKGIIFARGTGSSLFPVTRGVSKQLLPVCDKTLIYCPSSVLMLAGIRKLPIVRTPEDKASFMRHLPGGGEFGLQLTYREQMTPSTFVWWSWTPEAGAFNRGKADASALERCCDGPLFLG